eukprot:1160517-Pelagomonas_calceolata.AAC.5
MLQYVKQTEASSSPNLPSSLLQLPLLMFDRQTTEGTRFRHMKDMLTLQSQPSNHWYRSKHAMKRGGVMEKAS